MIVNTSKTGQFTIPYSLQDNSSAFVPDVDDPWCQAENYPSARNILKRKIFYSGRPNSLSMEVDPTEDYVYIDNSNRVAAVSNVIDSANGFSPRDLLMPGTSIEQAGDISIRRRRFRWTKLWTRVPGSSGNDIIAVLRDDKLAHGVQVMVKRSTYTPQNLPYLGVHCTLSVEFRGAHQEINPAVMLSAKTSTSWLFPYTYAGGNSTS